MLTSRLKQSEGFTLIEILVASIVIALSVAAVTTAFINVDALNARARDVTIATQLVQQQMEVYRNTAFPSLPAGGTTVDLSSQMSSYPQLGSPRTFQAVFTDDNSNLKTVNITLTYTESGQTKQVEATTDIASRGINR